MNETSVTNFDILLFGATGDLAIRKLYPALYHSFYEDLLLAPFKIIGLSRSDLSQQEFKDYLLEHSFKHVDPALQDLKCFASFCDHLEYLMIDANNEEDYAILADHLNPERTRIIYLSVGPSLFTSICSNLNKHNLISDDTRLMVEKPLGHDLKSNIEINNEIASFFNEDQIYRIDHYLGKETVQNLMALRFANSLFEPLWRNSWIENIQITVAETVGMGDGRGAFYEQVGALRDMVQNHILQMLAIIAMEPPSTIDSNAIRDEKVKVIRSLRPIKGDDVDHKTIRGQYQEGAVEGELVSAYTDENGVDKNSSNETYCAMMVEIDNWRWKGVPFFLRTGKRLHQRETEIVINFRSVPHSIFEPTVENAANQLLIKLQPHEEISISVFNKVPGYSLNVHPLSLNLDLAQSREGRTRIAYERLILDAIRKDTTLFIRRDEQEAAWRFIDPIRRGWDERKRPPRRYVAGSWGPDSAATLIETYGGEWSNDGY